VRGNSNPNSKRGSSSGLARRNLPIKNDGRFKDLYNNNANEESSSRNAKRILKLNHGKGGYQFPKRERFNEEFDD
jgi:hypothetical protein